MGELRNWYQDLTCDEAMKALENEMQNLKSSFVAAGFYLKYIRDNEFYKEQGYASIWEFAKSKYGIETSTASRWMAINDRFSQGGNSPHLEEQYEKFGKSQLQEMLSLDDKQLEKVTPNMTVKEIREIRKEEKETSKPNTEQEKYLKAFARHLILCEKEWFLKDFSRRVLDVTTSPKEILGHFRENNRTRYFATDNGTAHINLFDNYVQIWDEKNKNLGNFEWFYLAREIQNMWNVVALELATKEEKEPIATSQCIHKDGFACTLPEAQKIAAGDGADCYKKCCWNCKERTLCGYACNASKENPFKEEIPGQMEVYDYPELLPEGMIEGEYKEIEPNPPLFEELAAVGDSCEEESDVELTEEYTDLNILKNMLNKEQKMLNNMKECCEEGELMLREQKIKVAALAGALYDLEEEEEKQEQPELPRLKNNDQRKEFLDNYHTWPVWFTVPEAAETYYRYDLSDGSSLVICEYRHYMEWMARYADENPDRTATREYILTPGYRYLHDCLTNRSTLVEHLKNVQKR